MLTTIIITGHEWRQTSQRIFSREIFPQSFLGILVLFLKNCNDSKCPYAMHQNNRIISIFFPTKKNVYAENKFHSYFLLKLRESYSKPLRTLHMLR